MNPGVIVDALAAGGVEVLAGVPDSTLHPLPDLWEASGREHIIACNEGAAVALAGGYALAGVRCGVYLQNTGLGIAMDAFGSLVGPDCLEQSLLYLVGWRGHPDTQDVAHHRWHGELAEVLCAQAGVETLRLPRGQADASQLVSSACASVRRGQSTALLVAPGTFASKPEAEQTDGLSRGAALAAVSAALGDAARFVVGVGYSGRHWAELRSVTPNADDVYASGGMGHAVSLAVGLARAQPQRRVVCIDGDGSFAMHLGASLVAAQHAPSSFLHVVLDNGQHESVGGAKSPLHRASAIALGCGLGYTQVAAARTVAEISAALLDSPTGPTLLVITTAVNGETAPSRPAARTLARATPRRSVVGPRLFTPGPGRLTFRVSQAMGVELGSRSRGLAACTASLRARITEMVADDSYTCVPVAGSATTALDAVLGSLLPTGHLTVVVAGRYGQRIADLAERWGHDVHVLRFATDRPASPGALAEALDAAPRKTRLALVHGETSTGVLHPIAALTAVAAERGIPVVLDAVGTIGTEPLALPDLGVDVLFASAAKGLEGPSGLGLVVVKRDLLARSPGGPSASLDLATAARRLDDDGQFPFTPPTHSLRGLASALDALEIEGGCAARGARYRRHADRLATGLQSLGLSVLGVPSQRMVAVLVVQAPRPVASLVSALAEAGIEVYAAADGELSRFRIGLVGVTLDDVEVLLANVGRYVDAGCGTASPV